MKKIKLLFLTMVVAGMGFSCSSDDDATEPDGYDENMSILGKWELKYTGTLVNGDEETLTEVVKQGDCAYDFIEFTDPNGLEWGWTDLNGNNACETTTAQGTWSRNDKYLTLTEGDFATEYYIYRYYNKNLKIGKEVQQNGNTYVQLWSYYKVIE